MSESSLAPPTGHDFSFDAMHSSTSKTNSYMSIGPSAMTSGCFVSSECLTRHLDPTH